MAVAAIARAAAKRGGKKKAKGKSKPKTRAAKRAARSKAAKKANRLSKSVRRAPVRWKIAKGKRDSYEAIFRDLFGPSPKGTSWSLLAERYPERFRDYLEAGLESEE